MAVNLETTLAEKARRALHPGQILYTFTVLNAVMKSGTRPPLRSVRLLDQLRERIRYCHCSLRTEQAYVYWVHAFIRFHGMRYPPKAHGRVPVVLSATAQPPATAGSDGRWPAQRLHSGSYNAPCPLAA